MNTRRTYLLTVAVCLTLFGLAPSGESMLTAGIPRQVHEPASTVTLAGGSPQSSHFDGTRVESLVVPLVVDGSKTPELIPDEIAYYHFIMAVAAPMIPAAERQACSARELDNVALPGADRTAVTKALVGVREELEDIYLVRQQPMSQSVGAQQALFDASSGRLMC